MPSTHTRKRPTTTRRYASLSQTAELCSVSVNTLRRRIADGSLTGYWFGPRVLRLDLNEVEALMRPTKDA